MYYDSSGSEYVHGGSGAYFTIKFCDLPPVVQGCVLGGFPDCVILGTLPTHVTDQIIVRSMIPCLPDNTMNFIKYMQVTLPDLYMSPCVGQSYDRSSIYRLPNQPVHPHTGSNIDAVCMCNKCKGMPKFLNQGVAWSHISGSMSVYRGNQMIKFPMTGYSDFSLPFTNGAHSGPTVTIELPPSMERATDANKVLVVKRTSFHKFLEFIRKRLTPDGKKVRSLRKVVARVKIGGIDGNIIEIRFKRDSDGNFFLLFSNPLNESKKRPASAIISYHDLHMVCSAWSSAMVRTNCDYLQRLQNVADLHPTNRNKHSRQTIPPIFRPLSELARNSCFLIRTNESESPMHQMLPHIPSAVIDIIGQYCCIANTGTPKYVVDMDGISRANLEYKPSSNTSTTIPVAGYGLGSFSTLFLDKLYDPKILERIASFLFLPSSSSLWA
jgi:hypothetical protein